MHRFCDRWEEQVIEEKKWREVMAAAFKFPPTNTSASFVLRRYYLSLPFVPPAGALLAHAVSSDYGDRDLEMSLQPPSCRDERGEVASDATAVWTPRSRKRPSDEQRNNGEAC